MGLLYSKTKIFHFKDKIDSLPKSTDKVMAPIHIRIKPTNICNHDCKYCAYRLENLQLGKDMVKKDHIPKDKMMEIIEDLKTMGVKAVTFSGGGDPFCYPFLLETVKKLISYSIKFAALTNGSRLKGEIAEIFAHHATWLRISIDGWDDESYSSYRGVPKGEFTKVLNNIARFKKLKGKCYLGIIIIVDKDNAMHVYDLIHCLWEAQVNSIKISPCIVSDDGEENNKYHQPFFAEVKKQIEKARGEFAEYGLEIFDAYHELDNKFRKDYNWCPYLQLLPVIGADLNVYACHDKAYNLNEGLIGSIRDLHFKDFWFSDKNKFFKINPAQVCNHHCVANEKNKMILDYLNAEEEHLSFI